MTVRVHSLDKIATSPFKTVVRPAPVTAGWWYRVAKRGGDLVVSVALLLLLAPVALLSAAALWVAAPGRPLGIGARAVGMGGVPFTMYRFGTEGRGLVGVAAERLCLDELPQLWNVLLGEMSLVGPRPPLEAEWSGFRMWQRRKLSVKPGLTGLWQVMGRSHIRDLDELVELDLEYVQRWSPWLDVQIAVVTPAALLASVLR